jgi:hypothetical protein
MTDAAVSPETAPAIGPPRPRSRPEGDHRRFEPYRRAVGPALAVVEEVRDILAASEQRQRRRQKPNEDRFALILNALIADLIRRLEEREGDGWLLISRSKRELSRRSNRYAASPVLTEMLITVQDQLAAVGLVELDKGEATGREGPRRMTRVRANTRLMEIAGRRGASAQDTIRELDPHEETIILRSEKDDDRSTALAYEDTAETDRRREEMLRLNSAFLAADLALVEDDLEPGAAYDLSDRFAYRVFNNASFDQGGRLFGPFWLTMKRRHRVALRIGGEPVSVVDYGQMALRLAYAREGVEPPRGDLYAIPGLFGVEREGVKKLVNAMLSTRQPLRQFPEGCRQLGFPRSMKIAEAVAAIRRHHALVASYFERGAGFALQKTESDIIVAVVLRLHSEGVTALPIHDGLLVPRSKADEAKLVMEEVFRSVTGFAVPVKIEDT